MRNLLSYSEVAEWLRIKPGTLYSMVSRREIPHLRVSPRVVRFDEAALVRWLERKEVNTPGILIGSEDAP
jgi:excisionase family DNA binding protein